MLLTQGKFMENLSYRDSKNGHDLFAISTIAQQKEPTEIHGYFNHQWERMTVPFIFIM